MYRLLPLALLAALFCARELAFARVARAEPASPPFTLAQAQPGSTGGSIGKKEKSVSSSDETQPRGERNPRSAPATRRAAPAAASALASKTFQNPMTNGMRTDLCQTAVPTGCGEPSANMWCQRKGYKRAASYKWGLGGPAWRQGEGSRCNGPCGVLTEVTCE